MQQYIVVGVVLATVAAVVTIVSTEEPGRPSLRARAALLARALRTRKPKKAGRLPKEGELAPRLPPSDAVAYGVPRRPGVRFGQALEVTAPEVEAPPEDAQLFTERSPSLGRAARILALVRLVLVLLLIGATVGVVFAGVAFEISRLTG
jgi:hypothetical protein